MAWAILLSADSEGKYYEIDLAVVKKNIPAAQ